MAADETSERMEIPLKLRSPAEGDLSPDCFCIDGGRYDSRAAG